MIAVLISLLFSLSACNSRNGDDQYSTPSQEIESPHYLIESEYSGDELDIIKLINQRIKFIFEENESRYMELFHATSPINGMSKYKLKTVKLLTEINIQEQKNSYFALVKAEDILMSGESYSSSYVFLKAKNTDGGWKIGDID
jgi:hypothetical protein